MSRWISLEVNGLRITCKARRLNIVLLVSLSVSKNDLDPRHLLLGESLIAERDVGA